MSVYSKWCDDDFLWRSHGLPRHLIQKQRIRDLGALRRKITHALHPDRSGIPIQLHPVEGMTTREILDFMISEGVPRRRIEADIERRRAGLAPGRTLVKEV